MGRSLIVLVLSFGSLSACGDDGATDGGVDSTVMCNAASDCDDGVFCNGAEACDPTNAAAGVDGCIAGDAPCPAATNCDEETDMCAANCGVSPDADMDGTDAIACGGTDCGRHQPQCVSWRNRSVRRQQPR